MNGNVLAEKWHFEDESRQYPRDYPIIIHTLTDQGVYIDHFPILKFTSPEFELPHGDTSIKLRWLHIPANNMQWVEKCFRKWYSESAGLEEETWMRKLRPAFPQIMNLPYHSRRMETTCVAGEDTHTLQKPLNIDNYFQSTPPKEYVSESIQKPLLTLYVPYMNWDSYGDYCFLRETYQNSIHGGPVRVSTSYRQQMETHLGPYIKEAAPLHPRRTLDQTYYPSLSDTTARDADQTISKWTGAGLKDEGRSNAALDSKMIMIDQLWSWVLDEKTILSVFPSQDLQYQHEGFTDLYSSMKQSWTNYETVWEIYAALMKEAATYLFRQDNRLFADMMDIYRWVINKKAANQAVYFQEFSLSHENEEVTSKSLDNRQELKLVIEITDIVDELNMIQQLIQKQRETLKLLILALRKFNFSETPEGKIVNTTIQDNRCDNHAQQWNVCIIHEGITNMADTIKILAQGISGASKDIVISTDERLVGIFEEIDFMKNNANYTHKMLLDLLDLKQKTAALTEARLTTQQGRAIMLFTIVTIIFLPLSFFTSYFGQNISELTGNEGNPSSWELWRYGTPISVVVILSALLIAYYIIKPNSRIWFWQKYPISQSPV